MPQERNDEVADWLRAYAASHDAATGARIVAAHLHLADRVASRFHGTCDADHQDLVQTARLGLVKALHRYDPDRGAPFGAYAVRYMTGEVKRYLGDTCWPLHITRPVETLGALRGRAPVSLDQPADQEATSLGELLPAPPDELEPEDRLLLAELLRTLPALQRRAVVLYYFGQLTQRETATRLGCSQMQVSRLLRRALTHMAAADHAERPAPARASSRHATGRLLGGPGGHAGQPRAGAGRRIT
ncbi:MAG TPA: sigma-70 family RNA polymerase sigma factor [Actinomycetota bacterium]|jgi:RNA polymerase sigma-B factor|nr:sigma-70 family RNA polymerase sigma factor [Actinomycetota bacterium]